MSKGSRARPLSIPQKEFDNKWDAIFGKKKTDPADSSQETAEKKQPEDNN